MQLVLSDYWTNVSYELAYFSESNKYSATSVVRFLNKWLYWTVALVNKPIKYNQCILILEQVTLMNYFLLVNKPRQHDQCSLILESMTLKTISF